MYLLSVVIMEQRSGEKALNSMWSAAVAGIRGTLAACQPEVRVCM